MLPSSALAGVIAATMLLLASPARAMPCGLPTDCPSGFCVDKVCCDKQCDGRCDGCSAIAKGGGADGTCGLAAAGKVCFPAHCGGATLDYFSDSLCDAAGNCVDPVPVSCLHNNPCKFDLCSTTGCEQSTKLDGTPCDMGMVCNNGICGTTMTTSSTVSSTSSSGAGGASGTGGATGSGGSATGDYPPIHDPGCGCRAAGGAPAGGAAAMGAALLALVLRRRTSR